MVDAVFVIPAVVLRNLSDKLYEKQKYAAFELEGIVKQPAAIGDHEKISAVISLLTTEFTYSLQANYQKGGLIGLAAVTVGLTSEAAKHLEVVRGDFIIFFNQIFDALCELSANSDANVQSAAHLLDRLVKDIVTENEQFREVDESKLREVCEAFLGPPTGMA